MVDTNEKYKCLNHEDKKLILKIIDDTINRELADLRRIETMRAQTMKRPPFVGSFIGIRSYLLKSKEEFKKDVENLKKRIEAYPRCTEMKPSATEIEINIRRPESEIPIQYAERKLHLLKME